MYPVVLRDINKSKVATTKTKRYKTMTQSAACFDQHHQADIPNILRKCIHYIWKRDLISY
jgi:hypothetical protein